MHFIHTCMCNLLYMSMLHKNTCTITVQYKSHTAVHDSDLTRWLLMQTHTCKQIQTQTQTLQWFERQKTNMYTYIHKHAHKGILYMYANTRHKMHMCTHYTHTNAQYNTNTSETTTGCVGLQNCTASTDMPPQDTRAGSQYDTKCYANLMIKLHVHAYMYMGTHTVDNLSMTMHIQHWLQTTCKGNSPTTLSSTKVCTQVTPVISSLICAGRWTTSCLGQLNVLIATNCFSFSPFDSYSASSQYEYIAGHLVAHNTFTIDNIKAIFVDSKVESSDFTSGCERQWNVKGNAEQTM